MNDLTNYKANRDKIRPGDIVMFWGKGPLSWLIKFFASGPSHCGIVRQASHEGKSPTLLESSIIEGPNGKTHDGVQTSNLDWRVSHYDDGASMALLRLSEPVRKEIDWFKFYMFAGECCDRVKYDKIGLGEFLVREVPVLGTRIAQDEHKNLMVCSALVTAMLEHCGVLRGINWAKVTPQDLVEMNIYAEWLPLLGQPKLKRFNTI